MVCLNLQPTNYGENIMAKLIMQAQGANGTVELMSDRVIILRNGIWNIFKYGLNAKREIPLASISSVNFRNASLLKMGEISFEYAGRSHDDENGNTVMFAKKKQAEFLAVKEKIFEVIGQGRK